MTSPADASAAAAGPAELRVLLPSPEVLPPRRATAESSADPAGPEPRLVELYDSGPLSGHTPGMRVQANMVTTVDGAIAGADGRSSTISTPADMRVFSVLRSLADAVVVGAQTTRIERYTRLTEKTAYRAQRAARGQEPVPLLVIVSGTGSIDTARLAEQGTSPIVVHTATDDPETLAGLRGFCGAGNVVVHGDITPQAVLADLAVRGVRRVLCEGGPTLLGSWVSAGLVDELCLTVSPLLAGRDAEDHPGLLGTVPLPAPVPATPLSLLTDSATYIHRLALPAGPAAAAAAEGESP